MVVDSCDVGTGNITVAIDVAVALEAVIHAKYHIIDGGDIGTCHSSVLVHVTHMIRRGNGLARSSFDSHLFAIAIIIEYHEIGLANLQIGEGEREVLGVAIAQSYYLRLRATVVARVARIGLFLVELSHNVVTIGIGIGVLGVNWAFEALSR